MVPVEVLLRVAGSIVLPFLASFLPKLLLVASAVDSDWASYRQRLGERGEPLTFEEIDRSLPSLSPEANSAVLLLELRDELANLGDASRDEPVFFLGTATLDVFEPVDSRSLRQSRALRDAHHALIEKLEGLRDRPEGRWPHDWRDVENRFGTDKFDAETPRSASRLLQLDGSLKLIDGDSSSAADRIRLLWNLADSQKHEPSIISALVRMAIDSYALNLIERGLRLGSFDAAVLAEFDQRLVGRIREDRIQLPLQGERAMLVGVMRALLEDTVIFNFRDHRGRRISTAFIPDGLIRRNQLTACSFIDPLLEARSDPRRMTLLANDLDARIENLPVWDRAAKLLVPTLARPCELHMRLLLDMQCTRVIIAAERYHVAHQRLPSRIEDLVPAYLDSVGIDLYDGELLRFMATEEGVTVYSVFENSIDDGGRVAREEGQKRSLDYGRRLVRRDLRKIVLRFEPEKPSEPTSTK